MANYLHLTPGKLIFLCKTNFRIRDLLPNCIRLRICVVDTSAFWSYRQTATLWRLVATDSWGGQTTHEIAGLFLCDYAEEERRMVSARGDEFVTKLLLYTSLPGIKQGDMVLIGASGVADPYAAGAREVRAVATWADTFRPEGAPDFRIAT